MAETKEFNVAELIKGVPELGTERQQITYIPIEKILPSADNFYSLDGLDELAGSIETLGLQQPLLVRPIEGGKYELISGHRRRAAILMIRDGGSQQFAEGVPCIVIGIPVRYIHSHHCWCTAQDYRAAVELAVKICETLDGSVLESF